MAAPLTLTDNAPRNPGEKTDISPYQKCAPYIAHRISGSAAYTLLRFYSLQENLRLRLLLTRWELRFEASACFSINPFYLPLRRSSIL